MALTLPKVATVRREQRRVAPALGADGRHRERDQPRQRGERQQDRREPGHQREHVGRQRVDEPAAATPGPAPAERPQQVERRPAPAAKRIVPNHRRWATQSGRPRRVEDPVPGPHRPQVADVLVGDGAEADRRVPHRPRPARAAGRGRGRGRSWCRRSTQPGLGQQQREVGDRGQHRRGRRSRSSRRCRTVAQAGSCIVGRGAGEHRRSAATPHDARMAVLRPR